MMTPAYAMGTNTPKFRKIREPHTSASKYCLINYAYFRPQRRSKKKLWLNSYRFLSVSLKTLYWGPIPALLVLSVVCVLSQ